MRPASRSLVAAGLAAAVVLGCTDAGGPPADEGSDPDAADTATSDGEVEDGAVEVGVPPLLGGDDGIDHWPETRVELAEGTLTIAAKVADATERRQQGLMRVPELPDEAGMLFLFDEPRTGGFWMKDTLVPLDIAYLDGGAVAAIMQMDPCEADPCEIYDPGVRYDAALEVRQGLLAEAGIEVGDPVSWTAVVEVE